MDAKLRHLLVTCAGINDKSSFEAALLERAPGCELTCAQFGPEIEKIPNLKECAHFFPWALGGRNARQILYP
ncbi:hypothetical protein EDB83DRAFT_2328223 [Lactarius deliciosus]|nr:hypothetical protein EDB83DRAFT_2328223 [Lactarius deliciosus]